MKEKQLMSRRNFMQTSAAAGAAAVIPALLPVNSLIRQIPASVPSANPDGSAVPEKPLTIDLNFENANLGPYKIVAPDTISVGPISKHQHTWYSFKIKGVKNRKITLVFEWINTAKVTSNYGGEGNNTAMVTYDGKGFEIVKDVQFALKDPANDSGNFIQTIAHTFREDEALVSYCAPWSNTRMETLAAKWKSDPRVQIGNIGLSKFKKLPLTYFKVTDRAIPDKDKKKFFLIAREDSYEAGSSWAAEGLLNFILSNDPLAKEMLKQMVFIVFPIFSADGVALGTTNFPLDPENKTFIYVTAQWDQQPAVHEVQLMKAFWQKMKEEGFQPDVSFKLHSTCYWESHFRPEDCAPENLAAERELLSVLRKKLSWRIEDRPLNRPKTYMNHNFIQVFPNAITYSSHNDFIFTKRYLKTNKHVYRRHEDVMQDGELIARSFAEFYKIPSGVVAPYLMAGDVDRNCGEKGELITYSVYYYDVQQLPPSKVEVVINGRAYEMISEENADYSKPVRFTHSTRLKQERNDYRFQASNGKKSRRIPEGGYQLPGPFIVQNTESRLR